jgi:hypothetical protein
MTTMKSGWAGTGYIEPAQTKSRIYSYPTSVLCYKADESADESKK